MRPVLGALGVAVCVALASCLLFTGGTSGYAPAEGGVPTGVACIKPTDCTLGNYCCIVFDDAGIPGSACQPSCASPSQQLCGRASDCADAAACLQQACEVDDASVVVTTCGVIEQCIQ